MVKYVEVDPSEIPNLREGRRGRISYPILKGFLETGKFLVWLDRTGMQQSLQSLQSSLSAYIRSHDMPIKLFTRSGQIYLVRLDIDEEGNPVDDWQAREAALRGEPINPVPITPDEVEKRFKEEKDQTTK